MLLSLVNLILLHGKSQKLINNDCLLFFPNRLPELDSAFWGRLEMLCGENQYADEWIPVFLALLEMTRETIHVCY